MRYVDAVAKKADRQYAIDSVPKERKRELSEADIFPSDIRGDISVSLLASPVTGFAAAPLIGASRNKARSIRRRTGYQSPYEHDLLGNVTSSLLFGGAIGAGKVLYDTYVGKQDLTDALAGGAIYGGYAAAVPTILSAAAALLTRKRTIEAQADSDREPLWKRYFIPGYGGYNTFKRLGSETEK